MCKAGGEAAGEEADAREEVPGELAIVAGGDKLDEGVDKPAIYLEKCAVVHAIV